MTYNNGMAEMKENEWHKVAPFVTLLAAGLAAIGIVEANKLLSKHEAVLAGKTEPAEIFHPETPTPSPISTKETIIKGATGDVYIDVVDPEGRDRNCVTINKSGETITGAIESLGDGKYSNVAAGDIYKNGTHVLRFNNQDPPSSLNLNETIYPDGSVVVCEDVVVSSK